MIAVRCAGTANMPSKGSDGRFGTWLGCIAMATAIVIVMATAIVIVIVIVIAIARHRIWYPTFGNDYQRGRLTGKCECG